MAKCLRPTSADQGIEPGEERNKARDGHESPDAGYGAGIEGSAGRSVSSRAKPDRPRQRADRGDHELHEHEQSERDARRRFAREESGRARTAHRSGGENFARAGLARRHRLSRRRPDCKRISISSASTLSATVARLASATPGRFIRRSRKRSANSISSRPRSFPGNRNFEARVHQNIKANFLMSPPLVVAFALAGRVDLDLSNDPIGKDKDGKETFLRDLWPTLKRNSRRDAIGAHAGSFPQTLSRFRRSKSEVERNPVEHRRSLSSGTRRAITFTSRRSSRISRWKPGTIDDIRGARPLGIFGDSVTTDHISPAGAIKADLAGRPVSDVARNQAGGFQQLRLAARKRSGHDARNVRQRADQEPDGAGNGRWRDRCTIPSGEQMSIFDAAMQLSGRECAADHSGGTRIWHRFVARLGGERNAFARRESCGRGEFRAHSSLEPRRHGRVAVAISRWRDCAIARPRWFGDFLDRRIVRRDSTGQHVDA